MSKGLAVAAVVSTVLASVVPAVASGSVGVCFRTETGGLQAVERTVPDDADRIEAALLALCSGPTVDERASGLFSAIPEGTTVVSVVVEPDFVVVEFSDAVVAGLDDARLEALSEQVRATLWGLGLDLSTRLTVGGRLLSEYLPPIAPVEPGPPILIAGPPLEPQTAAGTALSGRLISLSPGHGLRWGGSSWVYDRPVYCAPLSREDIHNAELVAYLNTYLIQDGATTKVYRCINKTYGNHSTGNPWWYMGSSYWLQHIGYPCSIYASSTGDCTLGAGANEDSDNIRSRPLAADYDNTNIHISMHTNGYQGDCYGSNCPNGTCTYYDNSTEHASWGAISQALAQSINSAIVDAIRTKYTDTTWRDRGAIDAAGSFAETRIPNRAAALIELAFHDSCDRDGLYLRDNYFRSATMWATYKGICDYFGATPTYGFYSSEYVSDTIPSVMQPGQTYSVSITFRNRGVLWNETEAYRLGAVGDSDPFTATTRVAISGEVDTGQTYTFTFSMTAPTIEGAYTTDWRMVRDGFTWFGATHSEQVVVGTVPDMPVITQHPTNQSVPEGSTVTFSVEATGQAPLSYQWYKGGVGMTNGGRISGATGASLQIAGVITADQDSYQCTVTNAHGSASSNPASLTVTPNVFIVESRTGGMNVAKYSETGIWADTTAKSTAAGTTGGIGSRYGSTYRSVAGEKHALFNADLPVAGTYEVFVTWGGGSNRRSPVLHRLTHAGGTTDVNVDQTATLNVWVSLGTFQFNAGTNAGRVDVNNLNIDVSGSMYADAVKWEYLGAVAPPTITQHPQARSICPGSNTTMTVTATGQGTLGYQWQKNGVDVSNGGHYSGATTATLSISSADEGDAGNYRCVVFNGGGSVTSNAAALTLKAATTITEHPLPQGVLETGTAVFTVAASGEGTLTYRWQKDAVDLSNGGHYAGVTTATLTVSNCDSSDEGNYRCVVTGDCGAATSAEASLAITGPPSVPGDYDNDQDVDQADFGQLQACFSGSSVPQLDEGCASARIDGDSDVDDLDLAIFLGCFTGPGIPGDPGCANP